MGLHPLYNTGKSSGRQASRHEEWKENNARTADEHILSSVNIIIFERSINSIDRSIIMTPGYFLGALIRFDRRNVKFMTHRTISRRRRAINNNQELTDHGRQLNNVSAQFIMRANCARESAVRRLKTPSFYRNSSSCRRIGAGTLTALYRGQR